jgi:hypothetical protein
MVVSGDPLLLTTSAGTSHIGAPGAAVGLQGSGPRLSLFFFFSFFFSHYPMGSGVTTGGWRFAFGHTIYYAPYYFLADMTTVRKARRHLEQHALGVNWVGSLATTRTQATVHKLIYYYLTN